MNELEKRAKAEHKTIEEHTVTVNSTKEHDDLLEQIKAQGGEVIAVNPMRGKDSFTIQYRVLKD